MKKDRSSTFSIAGWEVKTTVGDLPTMFDNYVSNAQFVEQIDLERKEKEGVFFVAIKNTLGSSHNWPSTVIAQRYSPDDYAGFSPGILLVPETSILFIGAGTRLLAYDLAQQEKIWNSNVHVGFWGWEQHGEIVLMLAELELVAWSTKGEKLWSRRVEPPWTISVKGDKVSLDIMGRISKFSITSGV